MTFPERYSGLPSYAFPRLRALLDHLDPGGDPVYMTIGEPKHAFPDWVMNVIDEHAHEFGRYPSNEGTPKLLAAISGYLKRRYSVEVPTDQIMALNGTREGLHNALLALCSEKTIRGDQPIILIPNPFYQVYAVAARTIGAEPMFVPATAATGHLPDYMSLSPKVLNRVEVAYICSPANPQGAVADRDYWANLIQLAEKFDFKIFADECYGEIYRATPPVGAMEVAHEGGEDPERLTIFHSLSKRSNLPGLRSGFVASGPESIARIRRLRNYAGSPIPLPLQRVSERAWEDDVHVAENRALYQEKFEMGDKVFAGVPGYMSPEAGFFLWLPLEDGETAAVKLWTETGVRVLPGAYLSRDVDGFNPGKGYVRAAMVAPKKEMQRGLIKLRDCLYT